MQGFLPPELLVAVLVLLDWRSIVRATLVCRTFYTLIHTSCLLQYRIELGAAGLEGALSFNAPASHAPTVSAPISERLEQLRGYLNAWRTLSCTRISSVRTPHLSELIAYEFVGGIFAVILRKNVPDDNGRYAKSLFVNVLPGSKTAELLGGNDGGDEAASLIGESIALHEDLDVDCNDFAIDPTQDLLVFTEWSQRTTSQQADSPESLIAHIRTFSNNKPHPRASAATLKFTLDENEHFAVSIMAMQVCDDVLAVFTYSNLRSSDTEDAYPKCRLRVVVWDWTTGKRLLNRKFPFRSTQGISLISRDALMATVCEPKGAIQLYPLRKPSESSRRPIIRMLLPSLSSTARYASLGSHTGPFTAYAAKTRAWMEREGEEGKRIHVISMTITAGQRTPMHMMAIVSNSVLCRYARTYAEGPSMEIPWQEWGPANTRWLEGSVKADWLRYVHGARFVRSIETWEQTHQLQRHIQVLDFDVRLSDQDSSKHACDGDSSTHSHSGMKCYAATRNARCINKHVYDSHTDTASKVRYIPSKEPSVYRDPHFFREPVETRLPYLEITTKAAYNYSGLMIDGERIVGISRAWSDVSRNDSLHVHTF